MENLKSIIKEVLKEELKNISAHGTKEDRNVKEEKVEINSSADLNNFARRILEISGDAKLKSDILSRYYVFRLSTDGGRQVDAHHPISPVNKRLKSIEFTGGIITLKDVDALSQETRVIVVGKNSNFTPLARDEVRRRKIKIEREKND